MKHETAASLLLDAIDTKGEMSGDLREHAEECEECGALAGMHAALARAFEGQDASGAHLSSEDVVRIAMDRKDSASPHDDEARAHLRACARCAWEVRNVRSAENDSSFEAPRGKAVEARSLSLNWPAIAAGFAVLALLYPAYLGTVRLPAVSEERRELLASQDETKTRIASLETSLAESQHLLERSSAWNGAVQVPVLSPAVRGREPRMAHVPVENGQPLVALALDLTGADRLLTPAMHRVRVAGPEGTDLWLLDLPGSEIRDRIAVGGVLTLFVPAAKLPRGSYTVTVGPASGDPFFESPFTVTTGGFQPAAR